MNIAVRVATALIPLLLFANASVGNTESVLATRIQLQSAMQQHIDEHLVDGIYLHFDAREGKVRTLHPGAAHPVIMKLDKYFVLCSDFRDDAGKTVNIDFYLASQGNGYVVFQSIVENREVLGRLMKSGRVTRLD